MGTKSRVVSLNSTVGQANLLLAGSPSTMGPGSNAHGLLGGLLLLRSQLLLGWGLGLGSNSTGGLCGGGGSCWRLKDKRRGFGHRRCCMICNASQVCSMGSGVDNVGLELCRTLFTVEDLAVKNNQRQTGVEAFAATKAPSPSGFSRLTW